MLLLLRMIVSRLSLSSLSTTVVSLSWFVDCCLRTTWVIHLSQVSFELLCLSSKQLASLPGIFLMMFTFVDSHTWEYQGRQRGKLVPWGTRMSLFSIPQCLRRMRMCDKRKTRIMDPGLVKCTWNREGQLLSYRKSSFFQVTCKLLTSLPFLSLTMSGECSLLQKENGRIISREPRPRAGHLSLVYHLASLSPSVIMSSFWMALEVAFPFSEADGWMMMGERERCCRGRGERTRTRKRPIFEYKLSSRWREGFFFSLD